MNRAYYSDTISNFLNSPNGEIIANLVGANSFALEQTQRDAWYEEIKILRHALNGFHGSIYFEYSIPRMGERIDILLIIGHVIFVLEFKVGEKEFSSYGIEQVWDYALDLKNFHETSHDKIIAPILIATNAKDFPFRIAFPAHNDKLIDPIKCSVGQLRDVINEILGFAEGALINASEWEKGRYSPTPTIIEAAMSLYKRHNVSEISRNDASAINLGVTTKAIEELISYSKQNSRKSICFVTGVPGAGKTLVGLNIATQHNDKENQLNSVFLSGNGPLVKILCEALARDRVIQEKESGNKITKKKALSEVKAFIQNVHHYRDEYIKDQSPPHEHVALFDEAQRAWNLEQTSKFMIRKKKILDFNKSESEFLISCLNRHNDWAVVVCLVGGGQEINTGEAGINEWIQSIINSYKNWDVYISPNLTEEEYGSEKILNELQSHSTKIIFKPELHLSVSMRSFRAEHVSKFIKNILDLKIGEAKESFGKINEKYPIVLTRDLSEAKRWLKNKARGSERYGIVVSSQAERLKPLAIDVKSDMDPVNWFLNPKEDVRSSFYLEDVATEFDVQGLELDWVCLTWDADFRYSPDGWIHKSFKGSKWTNINSEQRKIYLKNAYRVLLTRARQGMVIVIPSGDPADPTRDPSFYNDTFHYLKDIGLPII